MNGKKRLIVTLHGIRTFGSWQLRLGTLLNEASDEELIIRHYKYGYFTIFAFLIPFLRSIAVRNFEKRLVDLLDETGAQRVDFVAHSFGTYLLYHALKHFANEPLPNIDKDIDQDIEINTVILCGSVLKPDTDFTNLVGSKRFVKRLVNECGLQDNVLLATLFVVGVGLGGRLGFHGFHGGAIINRYFPLSHSGFFEGTPEDHNSFMKEHWVDLLTTDQNVLPIDPPTQHVPWTDRIIRFLGENGSLATLAIYLVIFSSIATAFYSINASRNAAHEIRLETLLREVEVLTTQGDVETALAIINDDQTGLKAELRSGNQNVERVTRRILAQHSKRRIASVGELVGIDHATGHVILKDEEDSAYQLLNPDTGTSEKLENFTINTNYMFKFSQDGRFIYHEGDQSLAVYDTISETSYPDLKFQAFVQSTHFLNRNDETIALITFEKSSEADQYQIFRLSGGQYEELYAERTLASAWFGPNDQRILLHDQDEGVFIVDDNDQMRQLSGWIGGVKFVRSVKTSPTFLVGTDLGMVVKFNWSDLEMTPVLPFAPGLKFATTSKDGQLVAAAYQNSFLNIEYEVVGQFERRSFFGTSDDWNMANLIDMRFSNNNKHLLMTFEDWTFGGDAVVDMNGDLLPKFVKVPDQHYFSNVGFSLSPSGDFLLNYHDDGVTVFHIDDVKHPIMRIDDVKDDYRLIETDQPYLLVQHQSHWYRTLAQFNFGATLHSEQPEDEDAGISFTMQEYDDGKIFLTSEPKHQIWTSENDRLKFVEEFDRRFLNYSPKLRYRAIEKSNGFEVVDENGEVVNSVALDTKSLRATIISPSGDLVAFGYGSTEGWVSSSKVNSVLQLPTPGKTGLFGASGFQFLFNEDVVAYHVDDRLMFAKLDWAKNSTKLMHEMPALKYGVLENSDMGTNKIQFVISTQDEDDAFEHFTARFDGENLDVEAVENSIFKGKSPAIYDGWGSKLFAEDHLLLASASEGDKANVIYDNISGELIELENGITISDKMRFDFSALDKGVMVKIEGQERLEILNLAGDVLFKMGSKLENIDKFDEYQLIARSGRYFVTWGENSIGFWFLGDLLSLDGKELSERVSSLNPREMSVSERQRYYGG